MPKILYSLNKFVFFPFFPLLLKNTTRNYNMEIKSREGKRMLSLVSNSYYSYETKEILSKKGISFVKAIEKGTKIY